MPIKRFRKNRFRLDRSHLKSGLVVLMENGGAGVGDWEEVRAVHVIHYFSISP